MPPPFVSERVQLEWFPGGPPLHSIPFPRPDPSRPWGSSDCNTCSGFCAGHYLKPEDMSDVLPMKEPPSSILKRFYQKLGGKDPLEDELTQIAKKVLLPVCEVKIWLDHLCAVDTNRKRGAAKAAETRRNKLQKSRTSDSVNCRCGICNAIFGDSEETEYWIGCEKCDNWFHGVCVNITEENEPDKFYCSACE